MQARLLGAGIFEDCIGDTEATPNAYPCTDEKSPELRVPVRSARPVKGDNIATETEPNHQANKYPERHQQSLHFQSPGQGVKKRVLNLHRQDLVIF
jgi:hypothetical protein